MSQIACPICSTELTLAQLFAHEETQHAVARLAVVSMPLGARVLQYCTLFAPPKTRLTVPKQVKLMLQLLPDLERRAITHKGRLWAVPLALWAQGIDQMLAARDAGRLELPMSGHGYLYSILAGMADKHEAVIEAQAEAARRAPGAQVPMPGHRPLEKVLQPVPGSRDLELLKREEDRLLAKPAPANALALLAELRSNPFSPSPAKRHD